MIVAPHRLSLAIALGIAGVALLVLASLVTGSFPVRPLDVARVLWDAATGADSEVGANARAIVLQVRGPRIIAAVAVGAALGAAGAAFQNVFRNSLVSPDILGVSSGCALGATLAILFGLPAIVLQGFAFAGGIAAAGLVVLIGSRVRGHDRILTLVLTGVVVGSLFSAGVAFAKTVADPFNELRTVTFWLLGSFSGILPRDLWLGLPLIAVGLAPLVAMRWRINTLSLPDDEAQALGIDVARLRLMVIAAATLATSAAVAMAGVIGWVGLVVPHAARLLAGAGFARVLPLSAILGAAFMLLVDTVGRTALQSELPPGVLTALIGTPLFLALLATSGRRAS